MPSRPTSQDRSLRLALPATSANLGPAFDAAALALDFHLRLRAERAPDFFVTAEGRDAQICAWMGALTVARMANQVQAQVVEVKPKGKWPLLLAVPEASVSTEQARRVLPFQYSRADAVTNIQNSMLLLAAFTQDRPDLLPAALEDRIHQPYRAPLSPLLPALKGLLHHGS